MSCDLFCCKVCKAQVSRRNSFSLKKFTGEDGRVCRKHRMVIELLQEKLDENRLRRQVMWFATRYQLAALIAGIRLLYTLYGVPAEEVFNFMRHRRMDFNKIQEAKDALFRAGSPLMTAEEAYSAVENWICLA